VIKFKNLLPSPNRRRQRGCAPLGSTADSSEWFHQWIWQIDNTVVLECGLLSLLYKQASELEPVDKEINVSLQGIGLSLVNDKQHREIAYVAISRSDSHPFIQFLYQSIHQSMQMWYIIW